MNVLGIDPGTATTGYGVVRLSKDGVVAVGFGLIETSKDGSPGRRLEVIHSELVKIIAKFKPDVMAIEKLFFAANAKTAIRVGQAQGAMLLAAANESVEVFEYAPGSIKKMVTGDGRADKKTIQRNLRKILGNGIRSAPRKRTHFDNAADALAVALCHLATEKYINLGEGVKSLNGESKNR